MFGCVCVRECLCAPPIPCDLFFFQHIIDFYSATQVNVPEAGYGHATAQDACMIRHMSEVRMAQAGGLGCWLCA